MLPAEISYLDAFVSEVGINLVGILPSAPWEEYLPDELRYLPHRSILVLGAGGPELLTKCEAYTRKHGDLEHWVSDFAYQRLQAHHPDSLSRYLHPYRSGLSFPFQRAAVAAGLGIMGLNHVVLNQQWGPWFSLLGALVVDIALPATHPHAFDPCSNCAAPCLKACPAGAVSLDGYDGWACLETKLNHAPCLHACPARHACVVRADLRPTMIRLESARPKNDEETRALFRSFLEGRK